MNGPLLGKQGANLASASTVDLATASGNAVTITGTTSITALGTVQAGAVFTLTFSGILTLTHNGTSLILPTGANITTAADDVAQFQSLGSGNWKCTGYLRADGSALVGAPSSLAATLGVGNTTGGTDIEVSDSDNIVLKANTQPDVTVTNDTGLLGVDGGILVTYDDGGGNTGAFSGTDRLAFNSTTTAGTNEFLVGKPGGDPGVSITVSDGVDTQAIVLDPDGFTAPLNYQPSQSFTQPYEIVNKEYVDGRAIPAYATISLATWTALVAASGLVPGTFYRVTAAYTSVLFATDFDIEVLATSANTVAENCIIYNGGPPDDGFTSTDGAFTFAKIASTNFNGSYIAGAAITANNASPINFQPGSWVYINDSSSYKLKANVGSDGVISVENVLCIDPASPQYNLVGIYDVATDVLIPQTIRTQRIAISTGDIQAGTAIALSQFPAIAGYYWNATNVIVALTAGSTPYTTTLFIQANGATNDQWRYALTSATNEKVLITDRRTNGDCFPDNVGMEIQFSGSDFSGDGQAIVWVTAELLTT